MGLLCSFEGIDGAGKSTQAKLLNDHLVKLGYNTLLTREPGGSPVADKIREVIINNKMDELTEYFLFCASRNEHLINTIIPALDQGKIVICDRYIDSTRVYQPNYEIFIQKNKAVSRYNYTDNCIQPYFTFIIDIPAEFAMERSKNRGNTNEFDNRGLEFFINARNKYIDIYNKNVEGIFLINGYQDEKDVHLDILQILSMYKL
jgi:dTMP kinase